MSMIRRILENETISPPLVANRTAAQASSLHPGPATGVCAPSDPDIDENLFRLFGNHHQLRTRLSTPAVVFVQAQILGLST